MATHLDCTDPSDRDGAIATAAASLRRGRVVVVPGESHYLLACDAFSDAGVAGVREAKGRGDAPLSVVVGSRATLDGIAADITPAARDLIAAHWPGLVTLVLRQQPSLAWPLRERRLAVRMPLHPILLAVASVVGPVAVTTACRAGGTGTASFADMAADFEDDAHLLLDAADLTDMGRSTVVDVSGDPPTILRAGSVPATDLRAVCADLVSPDVT